MPAQFKTSLIRIIAVVILAPAFALAADESEEQRRPPQETIVGNQRTIRFDRRFTNGPDEDLRQPGEGTPRANAASTRPRDAYNLGEGMDEWNGILERLNESLLSVRAKTDLRRDLIQASALDGASIEKVLVMIYVYSPFRVDRAWVTLAPHGTIVDSRELGSALNSHSRITFQVPFGRLLPVLETLLLDGLSPTVSGIRIDLSNLHQVRVKGARPYQKTLQPPEVNTQMGRNSWMGQNSWLNLLGVPACADLFD